MHSSLQCKTIAKYGHIRFVIFYWLAQVMELHAICFVFVLLTLGTDLTLSVKTTTGKKKSAEQSDAAHGLLKDPKDRTLQEWKTFNREALILYSQAVHLPASGSNTDLTLALFNFHHSPSGNTGNVLQTPPTSQNSATVLPAVTHSTQSVLAISSSSPPVSTSTVTTSSSKHPYYFSLEC